ncbi:YjhX family toxin [Cucumibacter marinus]|uniref:YjhX family toxin n=1 Tax=Cucumibacter marinus TaxID=1121252 RepID=UPI00040DED4A|nr:YjhX family toxin [Cucumibacter marinus]
MNISKRERRVLQALAIGGRILIEKDENGRIEHLDCITREGWFLSDCTFEIFRKLRANRFIRSRNGGAYRITREGIEALQGQRA